jgi:hypothetical protein
MTQSKLIGVVLIIVGAGLAFWGYQISGGLGSQITQTVSGAMSDEVMYRYIGGAASAAVGAYLFVTS